MRAWLATPLNAIILGLLIVIGVAAGVGVVTYISALIQGLQGNTIERTLGTQAHLTVKPREERTEVALTVPGAGRGCEVMPVFSSGQTVRQAPDTWRGLQSPDLIFAAGGDDLGLERAEVGAAGLDEARLDQGRLGVAIDRLGGVHADAKLPRFLEADFAMPPVKPPPSPPELTPRPHRATIGPPHRKGW